MKVKDCMTKNVISVAADESVAVASRLMARYNIGTLPVRGQKGTLDGIVTDRDVVIHCIAHNKDPREAAVGEVMSNRIVAVSPETELKQAAKLMAQQQVRRLPVIDGGKLVGLVSLGDVSQQTALKSAAAESLSQIVSGIQTIS